MALTREEFLRVAGAATGALLLAGCEQSFAKVDESAKNPVNVGTKVEEVDPTATVTPKPVVKPTATKTLEPTPTTEPIKSNQTLDELETKGILTDLTTTPLLQDDLRSIGGYEKLEVSLVTVVGKMATNFNENISSDYKAIVVPEYAYDSVSAIIGAQNAALGRNLGVLKYDGEDKSIFNNRQVMWLVPFVSDNGAGLASDSDNNEVLMMTNVTSISVHTGDKLKPRGTFFVFNEEEGVTNVRPIPGQAIGGLLEVTVGGYGTSLVKVDQNTGKVLEMMVNNPVIYPVSPKLTDVWREIKNTAISESVAFAERYEPVWHESYTANVGPLNLPIFVGVTENLATKDQYEVEEFHFMGQEIIDAVGEWYVHACHARYRDIMGNSNVTYEQYLELLMKDEGKIKMLTFDKAPEGLMRGDATIDPKQGFSLVGTDDETMPIMINKELGIFYGELNGRLLMATNLFRRLKEYDVDYGKGGRYADWSYAKEETFISNCLADGIDVVGSVDSDCLITGIACQDIRISKDVKNWKKKLQEIFKQRISGAIKNQVFTLKR